MRPWILLGLLQIPSIRNYLVSSSLPSPLLAWGLVSIGILAGAYLFFHQPTVRTLAERIFQSRFTTLVLLAAIALTSYLIYPRIEGLGREGTGDDALVMPIQALLRGEWMYSVRLFDGAPISPGMGWLLVTGLFVASGTFGLMNTAYMGIAALLASYKHPTRIFSINSSMAFMLVSFVAIEQIYSRQDLLAIGWAFLICALLVDDHLNLWNAVWIGLLTGLAATSRIIFLYFPLIIVAIYWKKDVWAALRFGLTAGISALAWHIAGILLSNFYQPLHLLLDRGPNRVGIWLILAGGLTMLGCLILALRDPQDTEQRRFCWLALLTVLPLAFISLGELLSGGIDFAQWEAARYLLPALPLALFALFAPASVTSTAGPLLSQVVHDKPDV